MEEHPGSHVRSGGSWVWVPLALTWEDTDNKAWTSWWLRDPVWLGPHRSPSHPAIEISVWTYLHTHVSGVREERAGGVLGLSWFFPSTPSLLPLTNLKALCPFIMATDRSWGRGPGLLTQQAALLGLPIPPSCRCLASCPGLCTLLAGGAHQHLKKGFRASWSPGYPEHSPGRGCAFRSCSWGPAGS